MAQSRLAGRALARAIGNVGKRPPLPNFYFIIGRAPDYEFEGREFESLRARQI